MMTHAFNLILFLVIVISCHAQKVRGCQDKFSQEMNLINQEQSFITYRYFESKSYSFYYSYSDEIKTYLCSFTKSKVDTLFECSTEREILTVLEFGDTLLILTDSIMGHELLIKYQISSGKIFNSCNFEDVISGRGLSSNLYKVGLSNIEGTGRPCIRFTYVDEGVLFQEYYSLNTDQAFLLNSISIELIGEIIEWRNFSDEIIFFITRLDSNVYIGKIDDIKERRVTSITNLTSINNQMNFRNISIVQYDTFVIVNIPLREYEGSILFLCNSLSSMVREYHCDNVIMNIFSINFENMIILTNEKGNTRTFKIGDFYFEDNGYVRCFLFKKEEINAFFGVN